VKPRAAAASGAVCSTSLSDELSDNRDDRGTRRRTLVDDKASSGTGLLMVADARGFPDKEAVARRRSSRLDRKPILI
jgi:hypothetical protein